MNEVRFCRSRSGTMEILDPMLNTRMENQEQGWWILDSNFYFNKMYLVSSMIWIVSWYLNLLLSYSPLELLLVTQWYQCLICPRSPGLPEPASENQKNKNILKWTSLLFIHCNLFCDCLLMKQLTTTTQSRICAWKWQIHPPKFWNWISYSGVNILRKIQKGNPTYGYGICTLDFWNPRVDQECHPQLHYQR